MTLTARDKNLGAGIPTLLLLRKLQTRKFCMSFCVLSFCINLTNQFLLSPQAITALVGEDPSVLDDRCGVSGSVWYPMAADSPLGGDDSFSDTKSDSDSEDSGDDQMSPDTSMEVDSSSVSCM